MNAPVILFAYNRPDHLRRTLDALAANCGFDETTLFVCCDGPKAAADEEGVDRVRSLVRAFPRANLNLLESDINKGSARSIREGVSQFVEEFGRVVIIEDDLVTSRYFLAYMNAALDQYAAAERVLQVCGFGVRTGFERIPETFFTPLVSSWGWGTWKRAWDGFAKADLDAGFKELQQSQRLRHQYDLEGRYPMYFSLRRSIRRQTQTWDIRWQLYLFLTEGLALWPARSFVKNIGADGSGVHGGRWRRDASEMVTDLADRPIQSFPSRTEVDLEVWRAVRQAVVAANPIWHRWLTWWTRQFP